MGKKAYVGHARIRSLALCAAGLLLSQAGFQGAMAQQPAPKAAQKMGAKLTEADWAIIERAGFGPTAAIVEDYEGLGRAAWLEKQLNFVGDACLPAQARSMVAALPYQGYDPAATAKDVREMGRQAKDAGPEAKQAFQKAYRREPVEQAFERRSIRALYCDHPLQEKLASFFFNHFNVYAQKANVAIFLPDYEEHAIRDHLFGRFQDLVEATLRHPAMMEYLDNAQNAKGKINENYARELMELHTLGVDGGYAQADVQELARILTGASVGLGLPARAERPQPRGSASRGAGNGPVNLPNGFAFYPGRHDEGAKRLLGVDYPAGGGAAEISRAVAQLSNHPSTAKFISAKLARYFIGDEPSEALVAKLSKDFVRSHGDLKSLMRVLVHSPEFASPASKFKEPQDWVYSAVRLQYGSDLIVNYRPLQRWMSELGQPTYLRLTPDGWGAKSSDWASADQMGKRFDAAKQIAAGAGALFSPKPEEGVPIDQAARKAAAQGKPSHPQELWDLSWRYSGGGLLDALNEAKGEPERRALVLASPLFMKK